MNHRAVIVRARTEQEIAGALVRLADAGLSPEAAEKVARHPTWGPVSLGPGVIVSLFAAGEAAPLAAEAVAS